MLTHPYPQRKLPLLAPSGTSLRTLRRKREFASPTNPWLVPLFDVIKFGVTVALVPQFFGAFDVPVPPLGAVTIVGDDSEQARGPAAFDTSSLNALLTQAHAIAQIVCRAIPELYTDAAISAVLGGFVVLTETRLKREHDWFSVVERHRSHTAIPAALCKAEGRA